MHKIAAQYARHAAESVRPDLWAGLQLAIVPAATPGGTQVINLVPNRTDGQLDDVASVDDFVPGKIGKAVQFDSTNEGCIVVPHHDEYSTLPSGTTAAPGALSWVWLVKRPAGKEIGWAKYENHTPFLGEWLLQTSSTHNLLWQILGGNATTRMGIDANAAVPADEWTVIAGRYPGGGAGPASMELFYNGIRQGQTTVFSSTPTNHANRGGVVSIGTGIYTGVHGSRRDDQFGGLLVFPRRFLSVPEIQELSNDIFLPFRRRAVTPYWVMSGDPPASNIPVIMNHRRLIGCA